MRELAAPASLRLAAIALFVAVSVAAIVAAPPLGHDESAYAEGGRSLLARDGGYPAYRPQAMRVLGAAGVLLGGSEIALRVVPAAIALAFLLVSARLARQLHGPEAAAALALLLATHAALQQRGHELLSDIPSAACLVGACSLFVEASRRPARARAWLALGGLLVLSFYLRYGSLPTALGLLGGMFILAPGEIRRAGVAIAALTLAVGLVPFLVGSHTSTGSPFGLLATARKLGGRVYPGDGLVFYGTRWFADVFGPLLGLTAAGGIGAALYRWLRGPRADSRALEAVLGGVALWHLTWGGLVAHGEPRYALFTGAVAGALGAGAAGRALVRRPRAMVALAVVAAVGSIVWTSRVLAGRKREREPVLAAAAAIRADAAGQACHAYTTNLPQIAWYSRCTASGYPPELAPEAIGMARRTYATWLERQRHPQAAPPAQIARRAVVLEEIASPSPTARVVRVVPLGPPAGR